MAGWQCLSGDKELTRTLAAGGALGGTAQAIGGPFDKEGAIGKAFTTQGTIGASVQHLGGQGENSSYSGTTGK